MLSVPLMVAVPPALFLRMRHQMGGEMSRTHRAFCNVLIWMVAPTFVVFGLKAALSDFAADFSLGAQARKGC